MKKRDNGFEVYPCQTEQGRYGARLLGKDGQLLWQASKTYASPHSATVGVALLRSYAKRAPLRLVNERGEVIG